MIDSKHFSGDRGWGIRNGRGDVPKKKTGKRKGQLNGRVSTGVWNLRELRKEAQ